MRVKDIRKPQFFQLLINYRSHGGIMDCAHSTIELIKNFWPDSIDSLRRERGLVAGPKPVFLSEWVDGQEESFFRMDEEYVWLFYCFTKMHKVSHCFYRGSPIELGAHQCK